ncbi:GNAT family N-acetyltransferase [Haloechinothrix halophila]|uniref:GNAT family N-acetyltransferase n=1 Tax=Haloechinothrix halophila TaxID=1069073 RepID=UPI0003FD09E7|nr:GNAT family protein [Haloechinothrix halophila]
MTPDHLRISTDRLLLRPFTHDDAPAFADMQARPDVTRYLMHEPRDEQASRQALERNRGLRFEADGDRLALAGTDKTSGGFVGEFMLVLQSREHRGGEVGYVIHPDHQGKGYATEGTREMLRLGFDTLGLHRIVGRLDARNDASAAVLRKLGMRHEARFMRNEFVKGEWTDEDVYALLADEWRDAAGGHSEGRLRIAGDAKTPFTSSPRGTRRT